MICKKPCTGHPRDLKHDSGSFHGSRPNPQAEYAKPRNKQLLKGEGCDFCVARSPAVTDLIVCRSLEVTTSVMPPCRSNEIWKISSTGPRSMLLREQACEPFAMLLEGDWMICRKHRKTRGMLMSAFLHQTKRATCHTVVVPKITSRNTVSVGFVFHYTRLNSVLLQQVSVPVARFDSE